MKDLMPLENLSPTEIFSNGALESLLKEIDKEARSHVPDLTTDKGRKAIASISAKVAKSKTYLDGLGKDLVSGWKSQAKSVDNERKKMRDTLDELKANVRQPLTDWEDAETARIESIQKEIEDLLLTGNSFIEQHLTLSLQMMKDRLSEIENESEIEGLAEFKNRYDEVKIATLTKIRESITRREKHDADKLELNALRIEKEKRDEADRIAIEAKERAEREELIAKQAKEKAENEAKEKTERAEKEKQDAIKAKEDAEKRAVQAEKQAKIDAENAKNAEKERAEKEKQDAILEAEKREADTTHKKKINNEAVACLMEHGLRKEDAIKAITSIAKKEVTNVTISY